MNAILSHEPFDLEEAASRAAILMFLQEQQRFWQRDNYVGHLTASAWVMNQARSHVLLTHHKTFDCWLQLGGHIEAHDKSLLAAALREAQEESGIQDIEPLQPAIFDLGHHPIDTRKEPPHVHYDIRFLFLANDMQFVVSDESHALKWVALEEVPAVTRSTVLQRMARKLLQTSKEAYSGTRFD